MHSSANESKNGIAAIRHFPVALALAVLAGCTTSDVTPERQLKAQWLEPTGQTVEFNPMLYVDFDDYIAHTREHLTAHKVYLDPNNADAELEVATPFKLLPHEVTPAAHCDQPNGPSRGIVLLHGLSDMPLAMEDVALGFASRCFVAYSMLLPGHGARPAELLEVSRDDWLAASQFGVAAMQQEVDEVYIGGFSLGGLVALQTAMNNPDIAGVFGFSPAISLHRSFYLDQTIWLRYVLDWLDTDLPDDPWRFEAIPYNALAETQLLAKSVREQLSKAPYTSPIFIAQSPDDGVVNAVVNQSLFETTMTHTASRLLSYTHRVSDSVSDSRVIIYPSELPEQRILAYAHQAVHISPDNTHYGVDGVYRSCSINTGNVDAKAIERCRNVAFPFRGEVFGSAVSRYNKNAIDTLARLTFNPQFSELFVEIDRFLTALESSVVEPHSGAQVKTSLHSILGANQTVANGS